MKKRFFVFAALILATAAVVFAQAPSVTAGSPAMYGWESPQSVATQGRYRSAADNFIRPDAYTGVTFDKFFAMTSFQFTNKAQLGYATKIGSLYLGAAYGGSFWAGYTPLNYSEYEEGSWPGGSKKVPHYNFDLDDPFSGGGYTDNRIAVLIGVANMGFRFTFSSINHEWISLKDSVVGGTQLKSYEADRGTITPQIAWAMAKDLTENGIRPYAILDLGFARDHIKGEGAAGGGEYVMRSENHFDPKLTLGLGGFTFYKNDSSFRLSADFEYALELRIYDNEYNYRDSNGEIKISTIKGINDGSGLTENTYSGHLLTPALFGQWSGGPLALRFRLNLPVTIISAGSTVMTPNGSGLDSGSETSTTSIGFAPNLRLAAQWKIVPKLTLNAGGRITLASVYRRTVDYDSKTTPSITSQSITEGYGATTNNLTVGVTFLPTDNLTFEASCGVGNNNIKVFDPDGLLGFTNLLVGLKF